MEITTLIIAILALIVAGLGAYFTNKRSLEALRIAKESQSSALWAKVQEAVQALVAFDPASEPVGDRLLKLRVALIELVDTWPEWEGFDAWLAAEHALGVNLGRQVMEQSRKDDTLDRRLAVLEPCSAWAQALGSNLRVIRSRGFDGDVAVKLRGIAETRVKALVQGNGWEAPDRTVRFEPLDP